MVGRRLVSGSREARVALAAPSAARHDESIPGFDEIVQQFAGVCVVDDRAHRSRHFDRSAVPPCTVAAFAVPSALGFVLGVEAKVKKSVVMLAGYEDNIAAAPSVASAGSAPGNKFFPAESETAVAAVACLDADLNFVNEQRFESFTPRDGR